ncbi:MAG: hypothetical protein IT320_14385 [Anaerolineae bacterium]|nr:hypothetical protein [Anaerolineae bacterium]
MPRSERLRPLALFGFYLLVALGITYPLITIWSTHFAGHPFGDSYEIARHIWWIDHALKTGQPLFYQPLLLYPQGMPSAYFWGNPLQLFPAWLLAFIMTLPAAYNTQIVLTLALNGWAMSLLARHLTGSAPAALVAGVIYMAYPTMQGHLAAGHVGLLAQWSIPLYVLALLHLLKAEDARRVRALTAAAAVCLALSALGSTQMPIFTTLPITLWFLVRAWKRWRDVRRIVVVAVLGGLLLAIFAVPALVETLNAPALVRDEGGAVRFSADLLALVAPSPYHPLYQSLEYNARILGADPFEGSAYLGIIAGLLAVLALMRARAARGWLWLGVAAWVLSLGPLLYVNGALATVRFDGYPSAIALPYAAIMNLPLVDIVRTPGRFNFAVALVIAILAAYGCAWLLRSRVRGWVAWASALILAALILFDYQVWWGDSGPDLPVVSAEIPAEISALSQREDVRAVFHIPWQHLLVDKDALWLQTGYQQPMIAGHVTRRTPLEPARGWLLQTLDPALLDANGVDIIILHKEWAEPDFSAEAFERLGTPFYEDEALAAWEAPPVDQPLAPVTYVPPGSPGSQAEAYAFLPQPGNIHLQAEVTGNAQRFQMVIDGTAFAEWALDGTLSIDEQIARDAGYHALALVAVPACAESADPTLECRTLQANITLAVDDPS